MAVPSSSQYDVFLSHSSVDKPAVEELALWLVREGLTPFLDKWHLVPGEDWTDALPQALGDSTTCAVVIGPGAKGGWQTEEVKQALLRRVRERHHEARDRFRIIPVLLPGAKAPGTGEPSAFDFLAEYNWVQFYRTLDEDEPRFRLVCGIRGVPPGLRPGVPIVTGECPYRGLQIFDVAHAELFFGREKLTLDLVEMLRDQIASPGTRLLAVVGPSGSGKSSVVRAGLIPVLERGALEGSATWHRLIFKPGQDPFENLGIELAKLPGGAGLLAETRSFLGIDRFGRDHARSLHTAAKLALRDDPLSARLLVVADQFEEVYTLCKSEEDRRALIDNLLEAAMIPDGPVVLVLAMRADFLGKCAGYRKLADEISGRQKLIGKMEEDELRWAIEKPAVRAGGEIDPGLVELLLRDGGSDPGMLPLLEFALTQLWAQKTGRRMTVADYEAIGGLSGALKQRADTILVNLRKRGQEDICRRIFLDLIEPGEGTEDTRRRVAYGQLAGSPQWSEVVETLVRERLVTTDNPDDLKEGSIEIVHEALIQNWTMLQDWVNADRKNMVIRTDLEAAANKWIKNSQHPDFLLYGLPLANAQDWAKTHPDDLLRLSQVAQFLVESQKAEEKSKADEIAAARHLAEEATAREEAERKRAEEAEAAAKRQRRLAQRTLFAAVVAGLLALVAGIQTWRANQSVGKAREAANRADEAARLARTNEEKAKAQTKIADSRRIVALSESERDKHLDRSLLLAVEALNIENTLEARNSLFNALLARPELTSFLHNNEGGVQSVAFSPDGKTLAAGYVRLSYGDVSPGGGVVLWDVARRERLVDKPLAVAEGGVQSVAFSPDGKTLAAGYVHAGLHNGGVVLWDVTRRERLVDKPLVAMDEGAIRSVAFSPDGKTLAAGGGRGEVVLWDVARRERLVDKPLAVAEGWVGSVAFSPDGKTLAAGCDVGDHDGGVMLWDVARRERLVDKPLAVAEGWVGGVAISPDGKTLAAGYGGSVFSSVHVSGVLLFDVARRRRLGVPLAVPEGVIKSVAISPDGKILAAGCDVGDHDGGVVLWDVARRERLVDKPLAVAEGGVGRVAFSPDGKILAAGCDVGDHDGGVVLWDVTRRERLMDQPLAVADRRVGSVAFSPDGKTLAAGCTRFVGIIGAIRTGDGGVVLWDVTRRKRLVDQPLAVAECGGRSVVFSPDGKILAAGCDVGDHDGGVVLWDVTRRERLVDQPLAVADCGGESVAFSPDGKTLAEGYAGGVFSGVHVSGVLLFDVDPGSWQHRACRIANRNLLWDEWTQFFGRDVPYRRTCPDLPVPPEPPTSQKATKASTGSTGPATRDRR